MTKPSERGQGIKIKRTHRLPCTRSATWTLNGIHLLFLQAGIEVLLASFPVTWTPMVLNLCCTCGRNRGCPESCCALCPPGDGWQVLARVVNAICPIQTSASNNKRQVAGSSILPGTFYTTLLCDTFFHLVGQQLRAPEGRCRSCC